MSGFGKIGGLRKLQASRQVIHQPGRRVGYTVDNCGHDYGNLKAEPQHRNCVECWRVYFEGNPAVVTASKSVLKVFGQAALVKSHGEKFVKYLNRFLAERQQAVA